MEKVLDDEVGMIVNFHLYKFKIRHVMLSQHSLDILGLYFEKPNVFASLRPEIAQPLLHPFIDNGRDCLEARYRIALYIRQIPLLKGTRSPNIPLALNPFFLYFGSSAHDCVTHVYDTFFCDASTPDLRESAFMLMSFGFIRRTNDTIYLENNLIDISHANTGKVDPSDEYEFFNTIYLAMVKFVDGLKENGTIAGVGPLPTKTKKRMREQVYTVESIFDTFLKESSLSLLSIESQTRRRVLKRLWRAFLWRLIFCVNFAIDKNVVPAFLHYEKN